MSWTEVHTGKAKEVAVGVEGFLPKLEAVGIDTSELDDYEIEDEYLENDKYFWSREHKKLFEFIEHRESDDTDYLLEGYKDGDEINFSLIFYNGGASFGEVFDSLLDKLNKQ